MIRSFDFLFFGAWTATTGTSLATCEYWVVATAVVAVATAVAVAAIFTVLG
jgi:protein-S-isoprenylcysteine O-methyltransferase Ste14